MFETSFLLVGIVKDIYYTRCLSFCICLLEHMQIVVGKNRMREFKLITVERAFGKKILLPSYKTHKRHNQLLTVRIYGRIGNLGKNLPEVAV